MKYDVVFESERIYFVKVSLDLINDYLDMINDIEVQRFISHDRKTYSYDGEVEWIKSNLENNAFAFSMIEKDTNEFIGNIEVRGIKDGVGELGIAITSSKQDKHYGQEAIKRFIEYSFENLDINDLELNVYSFNPRAIKCYEKCGFVKDGVGKTPEDIHMILKR